MKLSILEDLSFLGKKRVSDQEGAPYIFSCLDSDRLGLSAKLISKHGPVLFEVAVLFARGGGPNDMLTQSQKRPIEWDSPPHYGPRFTDLE